MSDQNALLRVRVGDGRYAVEAQAFFCGRDLQVMLTGGEVPHIGAVALALPRPSLRDSAVCSASASVLCVTGHKEDDLARETALRLATACQVTVCVTAGVHIQDARGEELSLLA
ncbi:MAG: hypothetical protein RR135_05835, partial [Oscillospiraceae bacterium]